MRALDSFYNKLVSVFVHPAGQVIPSPNPVPFAVGFLVAVVAAVPTALFLNHH